MNLSLDISSEDWLYSDPATGVKSRTQHQLAAEAVLERYSPFIWWGAGRTRLKDVEQEEIVNPDFKDEDIHEYTMTTFASGENVQHAHLSVIPQVLYDGDPAYLIGEEEMIANQFALGVMPYRAIRNTRRMSLISPGVVMASSVKQVLNLTSKRTCL